MAAGTIPYSSVFAATERSTPMQTASEKDVRKSGCIDTQGWVIRPQCWVDEWRKLHPNKPAQCVAERLNAPVRTVEKWFTGESKPSFDWFGPILCAYGLGFVVAGIPEPTSALSDAAREEYRQHLLAERENIDAQLAAAWRERVGS